jgi:LDH2 family malate/lactate/ureidoglycolate dehydrogenase
VGLAVCNGSPSGHWVAAFGGREGRISTNPIAMAWPVEGAHPVVADFSTAVTAEGVVRVHRDQGRRVPDGTLRDAAGRPTDDPAALYDEPRGAIQPLGGPLGYRGTALALFVEVLTTLLNGDRVADTERKGTDMTMLAIAPQAGFGALASDLSAHIRSSIPLAPEAPVQMPGDREWARAASAPTSVRLATATWEALRRAAAAAGLDMPSAEPASSAP